MPSGEWCRNIGMWWKVVIGGEVDGRIEKGKSRWREGLRGGVVDRVLIGWRDGCGERVV